MTHPTFLALTPESRSQIDLLRRYLIACGADAEQMTDGVVLLTALDICLKNLPTDQLIGAFENAKEA